MKLKTDFYIITFEIEDFEVSVSDFRGFFLSVFDFRNFMIFSICEFLKNLAVRHSKIYKILTLLK